MLRQELERGLAVIGGSLVLAGRCMRHLGSLRYQWKRCLEQAYVMGYRTFTIVAILSFFIGAVLALQTGYSLGALTGATGFLGHIVGLSVCRELGPVMTAFLLAELAAMTVYQEVDALRTMNLSVERILVLPRLVAILVMMPALTLFAIVMGWYGGAVVGEYVDFINLSPQLYWRGLKTAVEFKSLVDGLVKAECFGFIVVLVACYNGLATKGGPREIGRAVTHAVVAAMILILIFDYLITKFQI
jgi:phospholipid/cholesterol/gamma-HCH transport system permease protein